MYDKLLEVKKVKLNGVTFRIRRVTPEDFLGKEGLPLCKWQIEADMWSEKMTKNEVTVKELQKLWRSLFDKALVTVNKKDPLPLLDTIVGNYYLSSSLYNEIMFHSMGVKKKLISRLLQKLRLSR